MSIFNRLFGKDPMAPVGERLYAALVEAARRPALYDERGAPDTVDGRFDMITMHAVLLIRRLNEGGQAGRAAGQAVFDRMFRDMDDALREMGIGDTSVGKKIKKMAEAFYGRANAYKTALDAGDADALSETIERNMLDELDRAGPAARRLADYMLKADAALQQQSPEALIEGERPRFPAAG